MPCAFETFAVNVPLWETFSEFGPEIVTLGGVHAGCFVLFGHRAVRGVRDLKGMTPDEVLEDRRSAWFVGTPEEIAEKMRQVAGLGVDLFMLQHFLLDDSDALSLLAAEVLPAVA